MLVHGSGDVVRHAGKECIEWETLVNRKAEKVESWHSAGFLLFSSYQLDPSPWDGAAHIQGSS